jgi:hypothetical protein
MISNPGLHGWSGAERQMLSTKVVRHHVKRNGRDVILNFFENPFVSLVNRPIDIRIVRFWRSM